MEIYMKSRWEVEGLCEGNSERGSEGKRGWVRIGGSYFCFSGSF